MNDFMNKWTIVIFGASGDLTKRKIIPALYEQSVKHYEKDPNFNKFISSVNFEENSSNKFDENLQDNFEKNFEENNFEKSFVQEKFKKIFGQDKNKNSCILQCKHLIIGIGANKVETDEIFEQAIPFIKNYNPIFGQEFKKDFFYLCFDFKNSDNYISLERLIKREEERCGFHEGKRLIYLSTYSEYFCLITENLVNSGIISPDKKYHRVVYEKPFGTDYNSARDINLCIKSKIKEDQIYRVDHYLAKEFVNNILILRYANTLFKNIWNKDSIAACKILFYENFGIEGRYMLDKIGIVRDVLQNHMLQLMALVTMESPASLEVENIRDEKAKILQKFKVVDGILGQYDGYLKEPNIPADSKTETYASIKLFVDHPNWEGVPFYLETGKCLSYKTTEIQLILKPVDKCIWNVKGFCEPNILTIKVTPEEGFSLRLNTKKPGTLNDIISLNFNFANQLLFGPMSLEAYETLFSEVMKGQQSVVVRFDEIEYQWKIADKIKEMNFPLFVYKKGTLGPVDKKPW